MEIEWLKAERVHIITNNEHLRADLLSAARWYNPKFDDDYYTKLFRKLQFGIQTKVSSLVIRSSHVLPELNALFGIMQGLGGVAERGAKYIHDSEQSFQNVFSKKHLRDSFIRHVFAAYIFEKMLNPSEFAFGISRGLARDLKKLEDYVQVEGDCHSYKR